MQDPTRNATSKTTKQQFQGEIGQTLWNTFWGETLHLQIMFEEIHCQDIEKTYRREIF